MTKKDQNLLFKHVDECGSKEYTRNVEDGTRFYTCRKCGVVLTTSKRKAAA